MLVGGQFDGYGELAIELASELAGKLAGGTELSCGGN